MTRRESDDLLESCWVPSFTHSSWTVDPIASAVAEGVVTATVGHAC